MSAKLKHFTPQSSTDDEEIDVESPIGKKRRTKSKHTKSKRRKLDEKKPTKSTETPPSSKRGSHTPSPSTPYRSGYKVPDELQLKEEEDDEEDDEEEEVQNSVQKYVEQLSQGLGLVAAATATTSQSPQSSKTPAAKRRKPQKKDSESSSEEERWLDAIQSGKLEEVDEELKKVKPKDPKLMTARQRAMLERKGDKEPEEQLLSLPSGYKEVVMTAEAIQRKAIKSQKRKEKADEKREKDKKKTMERLLKKQESKTMRGGARRTNRRNVPQISYRLTMCGPRLHLPAGFPSPLTAQLARPPPVPVICGVASCSNLKRYSCKTTGVPLCSLECYKANLALSTVV